MSEKKITLGEIENLIERFQQHAISTLEFCTSFEQIWNFEFEKKNIANEVFESLDFLFDEVALFCPLPREQWEYPKYRDETEIRAAAARALLSMAR
jgi:hypothetical protein